MPNVLQTLGFNTRTSSSLMVKFFYIPVLTGQRYLRLLWRTRIFYSHNFIQTSYRVKIYVENSEITVVSDFGSGFESGLWNLHQNPPKKPYSAPVRRYRYPLGSRKCLKLTCFAHYQYRYQNFFPLTGSTPPDSILKTFLEVADNVDGAMAG